MPRILATGAILALTLVGPAACDWVSLARQSVAYRTVAGAEAANVVAHDSGFAASRADSGVGIGERSTMRGAGRADDLAVDGRLLFVLDALPPGRLSVVSLGGEGREARVLDWREVAVGPFSGVAAANGVVVVSGGTSRLTAWRYDSAGLLAGPYATADLGRGQPDVLLSRDGTVAYVSTHYWGPRFGLDIVATAPDARGVLPLLGSLPLEGAGFTDGGAKPASFPIECALLDDGTVLVAHRRGVAVVDVRDPRMPRLVDVVDVGGPAVNVDALGGTAAVSVAGRRPAIVLLDFTRGASPGRKGIALPPGTLPLGVALSREQVAVAARGRGVLIFPR